MIQSRANTFVCDDGHVVRSKSEREIDNYLFRHNIAHAYEKKYIVDESHHITPDFYLPEFGVYIEHWGFDNDAKYLKAKQYKLDIYKSRNEKLKDATKADMSDINMALDQKLFKYMK